MNHRRYQYRKLNLNKIRVIELAPGRGSERLFGSIREVWMDGTTSYDALSYCWGDPTPAREFGTTEGSVPITESLFSTLTRLRHHAWFRTVWTDGICINQGSVEDRTQQVMLMEKIYSNAAITIIDLGAAAEDSELVFPLLRVVASNAFADGEGQVSQLSGSELGAAPLHKEAWAAFRALLRRQWFTRVWTIQEFLLSPVIDVMCGNWTVPWKTLAAACRKTISRRGPLITLDDVDFTRASQRGASTMVDMGLLRADLQNHGRKDMLELLEIFRSRQATKDCDHFFALLSTAKEGTDAAFRANYNESMEQVLLRYAAEFVNRGQAMNMLSSVGPHLKPVLSWIPDWTQPLAVSGTLLAYNGRHYRAGGNEKHSVQVDVEEKTLRIRGTSVGKVVQIGRVHGIKHELHSQIMTQFDEFGVAIGDVARLMGNLISYPSGETLEEVEWRAAIGNKPLASSFDGISSKTIYYGIKALIAAKPSSDAELYLPSMGQNASALLELTARMHADQTRNPGAVVEGYVGPLMQFLQGRKFCLVDNRYVGWVPLHAELGDEIVVFHGGRVPFAIRKCTEHVGRSIVIGEAYVHGIMNGEAITSVLRKDNWCRLC